MWQGVIFIKGYFVFTKRGLLCLFAFICLAILIVSGFYTAGKSSFDASTNADRIRFISSLNLKAKGECIAQKEVQIPDVFSDVYQNYNNLQLSADFDLNAYKGCKVTMFTYALDDYNPFSQETVVNLLVYNGRIIGGDISAVSINGFMLPLKRKENWNK